MIRRSVRVTGVIAASIAVSIAAASCSFERSSDPLSPTVAGPVPGVVIQQPQIVQPPNGAKVGADKPLTFTVTTVTSNGVRPITFFIEIAEDVQFKSIVLAKGGLGTIKGSQATFSLTENLVTDATYFWHVKADDGANTSPFSDAAQFTLFAPVIYQPPAAVAPSNNSTVANLRPKFSW